MSSNACASALRKICEDASALIDEPSNLEVLMWIGEVLDVTLVRCLLLFFKIYILRVFASLICVWEIVNQF